MPSRSYQDAGYSKYRYGFNGKEDDAEGSFQDYGMRAYNTKADVFWSVDPIASQYPFYSPYQFAGRSPIVATDLDGAEENINLHYPNGNSSNVNVAVNAKEFQQRISYFTNLAHKQNISIVNSDKLGSRWYQGGQLTVYVDEHWKKITKITYEGYSERSWYSALQGKDAGEISAPFKTAGFGVDYEQTIGRQDDTRGTKRDAGAEGTIKLQATIKTWGATENDLNTTISGSIYIDGASKIRDPNFPASTLDKGIKDRIDKFAAMKLPNVSVTNPSELFGYMSFTNNVPRLGLDYGGFFQPLNATIRIDYFKASFSVDIRGRTELKIGVSTGRGLEFKSSERAGYKVSYGVKIR